MSDQFYCRKLGGIRRRDFGHKSLRRNENDELIILEGTAEKGPWYNAWQFSDMAIQYYLSNGWIEFVEVE